MGWGGWIGWQGEFQSQNLRCFDKADAGFHTEDIGGPKDANVGKKSKVSKAEDVVSLRHAAFLERCSDGNHGSWRPRPLHRQAARKWLDQIDNQIQWSCNDAG